MAEPSTTLQQLRRMIAKELEMPFFKKYKNGFLAADSGDTTELTDTDLAQKDKFWNGAWVYRISSQEASQVTNFDAGTDTLVLEVPITTIALDDEYEIHNIWNAYDIHEAINAAIRDSRRIFFETVTDETLIIEEDQLAYSLSTLSKTPHMIQKVWLEQPTSVKRGTALSSTSSSIVVESAGILSDVNSNWKVSIYAGTGSGQSKDVDSVAANEIYIAGASWTTLPDTTSKYALWNPTQQIQDWRPWHAVRYDSMKEFPDVLYFSQRPVDFQGLRIRLEYVALPAELSAEADTTIIPSSFLVPAAISKLHGRKVKDTRVDRELHFAESRRYKEISDEWMIRNAPHRPDSNILSQAFTGYQPSATDPLNWNGD